MLHCIRPLVASDLIHEMTKVKRRFYQRGIWAKHMTYSNRAPETKGLTAFSDRPEAKQTYDYLRIYWECVGFGNVFRWYLECRSRSSTLKFSLVSMVCHR